VVALGGDGDELQIYHTSQPGIGAGTSERAGAGGHAPQQLRQAVPWASVETRRRGRQVLLYRRHPASAIGGGSEYLAGIDCLEWAALQQRRQRALQSPRSIFNLFASPPAHPSFNSALFPRPSLLPSPASSWARGAGGSGRPRRGAQQGGLSIGYRRSLPGGGATARAGPQVTAARCRTVTQRWSAGGVPPCPPRPALSSLVTHARAGDSLGAGVCGARAPSAAAGAAAGSPEPAGHHAQRQPGVAAIEPSEPAPRVELLLGCARTQCTSTGRERRAGELAST
jgi:hypothetical protein